MRRGLGYSRGLAVKFGPRTLIGFVLLIDLGRIIGGGLIWKKMQAMGSQGLG